jgi:hypothetical protein
VLTSLFPISEALPVSDAAEHARLQTVGNQLAHLLANHFYYPCVLLTQTDVGRLNAADRYLSDRFGWPVLSISDQLGAVLLSVAPKRRSRIAGQAAADAIGQLAPGPVVCSHIDLLFEPALELDPLRLLREASRLAPMVVLWPGQYQARVLSYAVPEHAHYRTWRQTELCDGCIIGL